MLRILHVDDSENDLELIKFQLTRHEEDLEIEWAESVKEALKKLETQEFDCILSGFQMPGANGLDLLKAVRDSGLSIPFIFLTGQGNEEIASEAMRAGADDYYTKDAGFAHYHRLLNSIKRVIEVHNRRSREEQARQALHESEEKYRNLVERANDLIVIIQDGLIKFANPRMAELLGYSVEETLETPFQNYIWPDEVEKLVDRHKRRMAGEAIPSISESALLHKNGQRVDVEINANRIDYGGGAASLVFIRDIKERKTAEQELWQSQKMLQLVLDATPVRLFWKDKESTYLGCNQLFAEDAGLSSPDEIIGKTDYDLVWREQAEVYRSYDREVISSGKPKLNYEELQTHIEGSEIVLRTSKIPLTEPDGSILGMLGVYEDITDSRRAGEALRLSEERLSLAFEAATDGLWDWNAATDETYFSPRYYTMLGYEPGEFSADQESWISLIHPDDKDRAVSQTEGIAKGEIDAFEEVFRLKTKSGEWRWVLSRGKVAQRDEQGNPLRIIGTHTDITDRRSIEEALRQSKERLALALDAATDGLWDWDVPTGKGYFSPRYYTMLGYQPGDFPASLDNWAALLHPDDKQFALGLVDGLTQGELDSFDGEFRMKAKSGEWRWILSRGKVVERDASGKPLRIVGTHVDVTKRREAESKLAESEQKYKAIVEASIDGILIGDARSGKLNFANRAACEMLGYSEAELLGMKMLDIHPKHYRKQASEGFTSASGSGLNLVEKAPIERKDGSTLHVDIATNTANIGGRTFIVGFLSDVTAQKQNEEILRDIERERTVILDNMIEHVVLHDTEMRIVWANKTACNSVHSSLEELVGRHCYQIWRERDNPCDRCPVSLTLKTGENHSEEIDSPDGRTWRIQASPVKDEDGNMVGAVESSIEITERRRAEKALQESVAQLRSIFEAAENISFILTDLDAQEPHIIEFSPGSERIYGYSREEALGMPVHRLHPPESSENIREIVARISKGGKGFTGETTCLRKNGESFPGSLNTLPITDDDGNVLAALGVSFDISGLKRAEQDVKDYAEQLERHAADLVAVNKELEAFSYSVSHDLQAPLRHIDGFTSLLLEEYADRLDDEGRGFLHRTKASAGYMSELINGMLKLSRLSRTELTREHVNMTQLATTIAEKLKASEPGRDVAFEIAEGLVGQGDVHLLHSALENLLGNAFKFTAKTKRGKIHFGAKPEEGRTVFFVRDNGAGFDPGKVGKLFIPFSRLHTEAEFEGTGIGLATVQRIIRRHGGTVWAEGQPGKGATFYFTLA